MASCNCSYCNYLSQPTKTKTNVKPETLTEVLAFAKAKLMAKKAV